jgi:hypothetical protein
MNSLFRMRKINKALKIYSDFFLGYYVDDIEEDLKKFYEKKVNENKTFFQIKNNIWGNIKSNISS